MQDDGQRGRIGNRLKVRVNAGLHRLVVIGHDRKHRIGARRFGAPGQLDGLAGRIGSGAGNDANAAARDLDGGADEASCSAGVRVEASPAVSPTTIAETPGFDLAFAKLRERRQIDRTVFVERGRKIGDVARQPGGGICKGGHGISRRVFHLAKTLPIGRKHKALLAPDTRLDPKTHLLQPGPDFQADAAFAGVDQDGDGRAGAEERRYLGERRLDGRSEFWPVIRPIACCPFGMRQVSVVATRMNPRRRSAR